jgi:hypothetical protein
MELKTPSGLSPHAMAGAKERLTSWSYCLDTTTLIDILQSKALQKCVWQIPMKKSLSLAN